jgi:tRNA dimethylallyltransferase
MTRLDKRVDKMVDNGLLEEIIALRREGTRIYGSENVIDHEEGIFQSIGRFAINSYPNDGVLLTIFIRRL